MLLTEKHIEKSMANSLHILLVKRLRQPLTMWEKLRVSVAGKTKELASKSQEAVYGALDQNGDGEVNIEDVILMGLRVPGIRVNGNSFFARSCKANARPK